MAAARGLAMDTPSVPLPVLDWAAVDVTALGTLYTALMSNQHGQGSYYTPRALADQVMGWTSLSLTPRPLTPAMLRIAWRGEGESPENPVRVLDPAMGSGHFLLAAADWLAGKAANSAARWAALRHLYGADSDPAAVELARLTLWLWAAHPGTQSHDLADRLRQGDMLAEALWEEGSFDVVIGNPPYASVFTRARGQAGERLTDQYETAGGSYDLAVPFVERAIRMTRIGGRCGLVLPNKLLAADYAQGLRRWIGGQAVVEVIADYAQAGTFDAGVYPVVCVFRRGEADASEAVRVIRDTPSSPQSPSPTVGGTERHLQITQRDLRGAPGDVWSPVLDPDFATLRRCWQDHAGRLGDIADITAGLTVGEAYDLREAVIDTPPNWLPSGFVPLVTTGLIERYRIGWGSRRAQYLKRTYHRPVIAAHALPPRRRDHAARPKLLIAGIGLAPRTALDRGEMLGSVGTLTVIGSAWPLGALCAWLNSALVARLYRALFGGLALSGGYLRFGRRELDRLPIPDLAADDPRLAALDALGSEAATGAIREAEIDALVAEMFGLEGWEARWRYDSKTNSGTSRP
jgi:hypothetical protein